MGHGRVGLDFDVYKVEGKETFEQFSHAGWLPSTATQHTPSGGLHLLYRYDAEAYHVGCGSFGGAEWKGTGGYLVLYGFDETPIAELHPKLLARIGSRRSDEAISGQHPRDLDARTRESVQLLEDHFGGHDAELRHNAEGKAYVVMTRPEKDAHDGISVSVGESTDGVAYFFTPNWPPFRMHQSVDMFMLRQMAGMAGPTISVTPQSEWLSAYSRVEQIRSERQVWLWKDFLPAGQLVLAGGFEKLGKSTALVWICARLTRGDLPGDFKDRPQDVLFISAEDDAPHILKPRIVAAGADQSRFYVLNPDPKAEGYSMAAVRDLHPALVVYDPWSVFLDLRAGATEHGEIAIRNALQPFAELASEGTTVCGIRHFRKGSPGDNPFDVMIGSRAWTAACRSVLFFTPDPSHPDEPAGLLYARGNLARPVPGSCYALISTPVLLDDGNTDDVPLFKLTGTTTITLDEALGPRQTPTERAKAEQLLTETLSSGRVQVERINALAGEKNVSTRTLHRAKKDLGVVSEYEGTGRSRVTYWRLPDKDCQDGQDCQEKE
jgi:hypothetical protein